MMARALHKLTDMTVKAEKASGRHSDGGRAVSMVFGVRF